MKIYRIIPFIMMLFLATSMMAQNPAQPSVEYRQKLSNEIVSKDSMLDDVYAPFNLWKSRLPKKLTLSAPLYYNPQTYLENRKIKYLQLPSDIGRYYIYEPFDLSVRLGNPTLSHLLYNKVSTKPF